MAEFLNPTTSLDARRQELLLARMTGGVTTASTSTTTNSLSSTNVPIGGNGAFTKPARSSASPEPHVSSSASLNTHANYPDTNSQPPAPPPPSSLDLCGVQHQLNNNHSIHVSSTTTNSNSQSQPPHPTLLQGQGESSNLSSAGSTSDREGGPETPEKGNPSSSAALQRLPPIQSSGKTGSDKKKRRRKYDSDGVEGGGTAAKTPRSDRKLEDFFNKQKHTSPQRASPSHSHTNSTFQPGPLQFEPISPQPVTGIMVGSAAQRTTPTGCLVGYAGSDGSASNQSPPSLTRNHALVQTDMTLETMKTAEEEQSKLNDTLNRYLEDVKQQLLKSQKKIEDQNLTLRKCRDQTKKLLSEQSIMERKQKRAQTMEDRLRLGQFVTERRGAHFEEAWSDGYAFDEVNKRLNKINTEREEISRATQQLRKMRKPNSSAQRESKRQQQQASQGVNTQVNTATTLPPSENTPAPSTATPPSTTSDDLFLRPETPKDLRLSAQEYYEQDEIYRLRREQLKKEEAENQAETARLDRERNLHIREMKRIQNEDSSRYKDHVTLNKRYLLLSLLGKGGFSEVWRAFDLEENRYVACKIHHVNKDWKEDKKANYVKHALREKDIHKTLIHPRIVQLFDVFTIDNHSFCTVLEYCDGNDLDFYLKQNKQIPEKEARSIIMQVVNALRYLNELKPPVIHYDLKPANILLSSSTASGEIKITDFGLSKIMEDDKYDPDVGMDLTSQGAGTYWYLPPECFVLGREPPKISSKVDVWSVGVIFYQCLYGRKPFGHEFTQARILEEKVILNATEVTFPNKPSVTSEAKAFIRCCLQYRKEDRADVFQLYSNEYLRPTRGNRSSQGSINPPLSPSPSPSPVVPATAAAPSVTSPSTASPGPTTPGTVSSNAPL